MSELKPVNLSNLERFLANIKARFVQIKNAVLSVNNTLPDAFGNVQISRVNMAGDLESSSIQANAGEFIVRSAGGEASINSGEAKLLSVQGRAVHTGYVSDEERGTISVSYPTKFVSTGWNLFQLSDDYSGYAGFARVINYGGAFRVAGTYGSLKFSTSLSSDRMDLAVSNGNIIGFPNGWQEGYIWATSGNSTDTAIYMAWGDWESGYQEDFAPYSHTDIDLSGLFGDGNDFPYGLLACGSAYDEIDLTAQNGGQAISRVERMAYTAENLETAQASGREWDADEQYIYLVRETPVITSALGIANTYTANDHGMEMFETTTVATYARCSYGASLRNKLERDVLTISQQTLTSAQQAQARANIGASPVLSTTAGVATPGTNISFQNVSTLRKYGNVVAARGTARVAANQTIAGTGGLLFTLPTGFRPSFTFYIYVWAEYSIGGKGVYRAIVNTDGTVKTSTGSGTFSGDIYYEFTMIL